MNRVERQIIKDKNKIKIIDQQCFLSKNLYNYCNYILRQSFTKTGKIPNQYELVGKLTKRDNKDFRALPNNVSQQIIYILYKNWKSFFKVIKSYKQNPSKFLGRPKLPKYKDKVKGRNCLIFTKVTCRIKHNEINFIKNIIPNFKTKVNQENLIQARMIPTANCYILEIIYKKGEIKCNTSKERVIGIDPGVNNLATCMNNVGEQPFIINGKTVKAMNQYYNKVIAELKSKLPEGQYTSKKINKITQKRNNKIHDYLHKSSHKIIQFCLKYNIGTIVIGHNKNWKQDGMKGRTKETRQRNNQNFVSIPFNTLFKQIQYKAEEVGINVKIHEESYSSKCDHFAYEKMGHHDQYLGKRKYRGLFLSSTGQVLNADVNGAIGIMRKVVGDSVIKQIADRGFRLNPIKINIS